MSEVSIAVPRRSAAVVGVVVAGVMLTVAGMGGLGGPGHAPIGHATYPVAAAQPAGVVAPTEADVNAWFDHWLPDALDRLNIAGVTATVVYAGEIVSARGYGYADTGAEGGAPVEVDPERHLFRPGSVSKLFTATAVLQLMERGQLDLDADIDQYLDLDLPRRYDTRITLRHLLTHTAGFEERLAGLFRDEEYEVDLRTEIVTDPPVQVYEPGTTPGYSNYGYALAGYIVERVSGVPFEDYVDRNIFDRAGMSSSTFRQPVPEGLRDRLAHGYGTASDGSPGPFEMVGVPPAGSLSAPVTDMARFMLALLGEPSEGQALLDEPTRALMQAPALDADTLGGLAEGPRMTLGFFDESRNGHRILGHGGDTKYFHSYLQIYPEHSVGVFLSFNSTGDSEAELHQLREEMLAEFADRHFPGRSPGEPVDEQRMREQAELAAGTYVDSRGFQSTFMSVANLLGQTTVSALPDGRLRFAPGPGIFQPAATYEQVSDTAWREVGGQRLIAMRIVDGEVVAIGHNSAFTLVRARSSEVVGLPVLGGAAAILVVSVIAWPVAAFVRRLRRREAPPSGRLPRLLSRLAVTSTVLSLVGWAGIVLALADLQDVPFLVIRTVQVLLLLGLAGLVPAVWRVSYDIRHRSGWLPVTGGVLIVVGLVSMAWFAVEFHLLAVDITY